MSDQRTSVPYELIPEAIERHEQVYVREPLFPILSPTEVWDGQTDLRDELPVEVRQYLPPNHKVIYIHKPGLRIPDTMPTAQELYPKLIGEKGQLMASIDLFGGTSRYQYEHGRDAMKTARDYYALKPQILKNVLLSLAGSQGVDNEVYKPGQPFGFEKTGSIILINRPSEDPLATKFERYKSWTSPYFYGSIDAPAMFVNNIALIIRDDPNFLFQAYTDKHGVPRTVADAFMRSVQFLLDRMEENSDGFVEYSNPVPGGGGMRNQGWQDSAHAMVHADGSWASSRHGIALLEVQAMTHDALRNAASIARTIFQNPKFANELVARAEHLRRTVPEKFWVDDKDGGYFSPGRERLAPNQSRTMNVKKSSMGWMLAFNLLDRKDPQHMQFAEQTLRVLMRPDMLTRYGIRTLSAEARAYNPEGYHDGSEWGQDLEMIAQGASNYGFYGIDRDLGARGTQKNQKSGAYFEHTSSYDTEDVQVPLRDTYVYNPDEDEVYMFEQVPPVAQAWEISAEIGRSHRYESLPLHATDPRKKELEDELLS